MDTTAPLSVDSTQSQKQSINNKSRTPTGGFNAHPENINRAGRPKADWTFKDLLREALEEYRDIKNKSGEVIARKQAKKLVIERLISKAAREGDTRAIDIIMDRIDGKVTQKVDHTTQGEKMLGPVIFMPEEKHE